MIAFAQHTTRVRDGEHRFLAPLFRALGVPELEIWTEPGQGELSRIGCGGHIHAIATVGGRRLALTWSDFRVHSATYSSEVSRTFVAFIRHLDAERIPLIYVVNSGGVSLLDGRTVFSDAFELWPTLLEYAERNLFLTCAVRRCLGLAPVLFGLGQYRVAVSGQTQINLTGPQVHQMFFRDATDFDQAAAAERFLERTGLVHELFDSTAEATRRLVDIALGRACVPAAAGPPAPEGTDATRALLAGLLDDEALELVPAWRGALRIFLGTFRGRRLGFFVNPVGQVDNMISARCLEKYEAGLDLFGRLGVPIVSLLDSPGMDPRFAESDADNIRTMLRVGERIIRYPHGSMGVVMGRCFGGATTLAFPKVFHGTRVVALRGARLGPMQESLIARLLEQSPRLLAQWRESLAHQGPDLGDLLAQGSIDAVVDRAELPAQLARFLDDLDRRGTATPNRIAARMNAAVRQAHGVVTVVSANGHGGHANGHGAHANGHAGHSNGTAVTVSNGRCATSLGIVGAHARNHDRPGPGPAPGPVTAPERGHLRRRTLRAAIVGLGHYLPGPPITNDELIARHGLRIKPSFIARNIGCETRHFAAPGQSTSDLAVEAAVRALESSPVSRQEVRRIVLATVSGDYPTPATACIVQRKLGLSGRAAIDIVGACSGFVQAMDVATRSVTTGEGPVLVIGADIRSRQVDFQDLRTAFLYGDGAGAAVLAEPGGDEGLWYSALTADGTGAEAVHIPAGGSREPITAEALEGRRHLISMPDGRRVAHHAREGFRALVERLHEETGLRVEDIGFFCLHQPNLPLLCGILDDLGIDRSRTWISFPRCGNTTSGALPIVMSEAAQAGRLRTGEWVCLAAVGAGFAAGIQLVRWGRSCS